MIEFLDSAPARENRWPVEIAVRRSSRLLLKFFVTAFALCFFSVGLVRADTIAEFVDTLKRGQVDLNTLVSLQVLEKSSEAIGYGICMASERQECDREGTLGYGLCMASGRSGCKKDGSLGYGLCMAGGRSSCDVGAKVGYGLCMAANRSGCAEDL